MEYDRKTLLKWFDQVDALIESARVDGLESKAVIYRGFKIEIFDTSAYLFDVRHRDLYTPVSKKNLKLMEKLGFVMACNKISLERNQQQIERSKRLMATMATKQKRLKSKDTPGSRRQYNGIENKRQQLMQDFFTYTQRVESLKRMFN